MCVCEVCGCVQWWMRVSEVHVCGFVFVWSMSGGGCVWSM